MGLWEASQVRLMHATTGEVLGQARAGFHPWGLALYRRERPVLVPNRDARAATILADSE